MGTKIIHGDVHVEGNLQVNGSNNIANIASVYEVIAEASLWDDPTSGNIYGFSFQVEGVGDCYVDDKYFCSFDENTINHTSGYTIIDITGLENGKAYKIKFIGFLNRISPYEQSVEASKYNYPILKKIIQWDRTLLSTYERQFYHIGADIEDFIIPNYLKQINQYTFYCTTFKALTVPSQVNSIGLRAFAETDSLKTMYFKQPAGMEVTLPTPGQNSGMCYSKTAKSMTIYTDNETIKNYNWVTDNITVTLYHLNGTAWEA